MSVVGEIYGNDKVFPRVAECLYLKGRYVALAYIYTYIGERIILRIVPVSFISLDMYDDGGTYCIYVCRRACFKPSFYAACYSCLYLYEREISTTNISIRIFRYGNVVTVDSSLPSPTRFSRCHANRSINKGKDYHFVEMHTVCPWNILRKDGESDRIIFTRFV